MSTAAAVEHLTEQIEHNQQVAERLAHASPELNQGLIELQDWQRRRLDACYDDLRQTARYRPACDFFLDELYGGKDFRERDRQLARVVPVMRRFLPDHLLFAVGDAMRLQAVSLEFDIDIAVLLLSADRLDQPAYAQAYRAHGAWDAREIQIDLINKLGEVLDETVHRPMVHRLVQMMRGPAILAGFGALQSFLGRGLNAFARMHGAAYFLETIVTRESEALAAMKTGSDWPFATWIDRGP
ncbi:MAG: hypothetical protein AAGJ52_07800 [Pseudomonadota bacterium]